MVNQPIGNHGLGIFWCDRICPWTPPSRSNEDSKLKSAYISLIIGPRGLFICLFGVLRRFQHCTGHITTGSWKGRGNQYI